jgi:hypothetical protein
MVFIKSYSWRELQEVLSTLTEQEASDLLVYERLHGKRSMIITRLHQRFTILRAKRERETLLAEIKRN